MLAGIQARLVGVRDEPRDPGGEQVANRKPIRMARQFASVQFNLDSSDPVVEMASLERIFANATRLVAPPSKLRKCLDDVRLTGIVQPEQDDQRRPLQLDL